MPPPGSNKPGPGQKSDNKKVKVGQDAKDIFQEILAKEKETSTWSAIILPTFAVGLLAGGIVCIILGGVIEIPDLIVLGVMLLIGAVIFGFMMIVVVCRPCCSRNQVNTYEYNETVRLYKPVPRQQIREQTTDYLLGQNPDEDVMDASNKPSPSENQLYGNTRRSPSSLATATNVNFESETDTPPPPQVVMPTAVGIVNPVYKMDVDEGSKRAHEMSELELL